MEPNRANHSAAGVRRRSVWFLGVLALALTGLFIFWPSTDETWRKLGVLLSMRTKEQLLLTMRKDAYFTAIEKRFPDVAQDAVDRGWRTRELGGNDADVSNTMRKAMTGIYPALVAQADDASLEGFALLALEQARAARDLSYEACGKLLESELNIAAALPPEYFDRERAWVMRALDAPVSDTARRSRMTVETSLGLLRSALRPEQIAAVMHPAAYQDQPALRCEAAIALYDAALSLPPDQKAAALEGLLKR